MRIIGSPNQVRAECQGGQTARSMCIQNRLFGKCFGVRVVAHPMIGIRYGFIDPSLVLTIKGDTGATSEDAL